MFIDYTYKLTQSDNQPNKIFFLSLSYTNPTSSTFNLKVHIPEYIKNDNKSYYITNNLLTVKLIKYTPCPSVY